MSRTRTNRKSREAVTGGMTHPEIAEILSAPAIGGPWGVHANLLVFQATNPPGSLFFRPGQMSITRSNF